MRLMARPPHCLALVLLGTSCPALMAQTPPPTLPSPAIDRLAALDRISSDSLKGHLSFLASDLLEGRDTPSRGLDLAAEYIAAQFRRSGLEPVGVDGYFQVADFEASESPRPSFSLQIATADSTLKLGMDDVRLTGVRTFQVADAPLFKVDFKSYTNLDRESLAGKAILVEWPDPRTLGPRERDSARLATGVFRSWASAVKASVLIVVTRDPGEIFGMGNLLVYDPKAPETLEQMARAEPNGRTPMVTCRAPDLVKIYEDHSVGPIPARVTTGLGEPVIRPVKLRNVAGILRGSDPALKETYLMVTAHYDHLGLRGPASGDRIYNGANDDGSGTVSVIEIASAIASLKDRPRRSLLFVTFFGEERGLLGSRYYGRHPLVPIDQTIADINLEQVGRTDDKEGARVGSAVLTGFGYSDVSKAFVASGKLEGVEVVKHPRNSDAFFGRSDNQALADLGVPAHTLCVAFEFPDYHGAADHWDKLDYPNMARVDRMVARTLLNLADDPVEPGWDETNPRAARYLKAWKARRAK